MRRPATLLRGHRGFTLIEILVSMIFLTLALLSLMWMNQASTRGAMDAYYEVLAQSLAQEPIEVFRALGYDWLEQHGAGLAEYPVGKWTPVGEGPDDEHSRPSEADFFSRLVELQRVSDGSGLPAYKIIVTVKPKGLSRVEAWLTRNQIQVAALVFPQTP